MAGFEDIAKKAFYMGVGFAGYAQEKANDALKDLRVQAQKLADEMAERGEISAEEARKFVDEMVEQAQQGKVPGNPNSNNQSDSREPRRIEIVDEVETPTPPTTPTPESASSKPSNNSNPSDNLREQVKSLQEELRRLKKEM